MNIRAAAFPLSFEQREYLQRGKTGFGTIAACAEISGPLNIDALTAAARYVVRRNEPLRMRLQYEGHAVNQIFADPDSSGISWTDLSITDGSEVCQHAEEKLDRERDGAIKFKFLRQDDNRSYVIALLDHLACDGWSSYLFLNELCEAYLATSQSGSCDQQPMRYTYSAYIMDQQKMLLRRSSDRKRAHWEKRAERFAESESGLLLCGSVIERAGRADLVAAIRPENAETAKQLASSLRLSPNIIPLAALTLACWSMTVANLTGLSFIYAGRDNPRTRLLLGLFRRVVPVLSNIQPQGVLAEFLGSLSKAVLDGVLLSRPPYLAYDFEAAVQKGRPAPVADVLFNQVDKIFGETHPGHLRPAGPQTTVRVLEAPHFWPVRWQTFRESRLRIVLGGGNCPALRAIFNEGCIAEKDVRCLLNRTVALLEAMQPGASQRPVREFVQSAIGGIA